MNVKYDGVLVLSIIMYHKDVEKKHVHFVLVTIDLYWLLSITVYDSRAKSSNKTLSKPYVIFHVKCQLICPISKTNLKLLNWFFFLCFADRTSQYNPNN